MRLLEKLNILPLPPSGAMTNFTKSIWQGENPEIPSYGSINIVIDYYGQYKGIEKARVHIPFGQLEKSYHVRLTPDGVFRVTCEGFFPSSI